LRIVGKSIGKRDGGRLVAEINSSPGPLDAKDPSGSLPPSSNLSAGREPRYLRINGIARGNKGTVQAGARSTGDMIRQPMGVQPRGAGMAAEIDTGPANRRDR